MSCNRHRGTTLVEVLVVIVVFLVGILAVVQIFPRGFQILTLTRKAAQANALARDLSEQLRANPDQLPEQILPIGPGTDAEDMATTWGDLGPYGDGINSAGMLTRNGSTIGAWALYSGANRFRGIVGETHRVPAPRRTGVDNAYYGGLLMPNFGPVDTAYPIVVSGNDLTRNNAAPAQLNQRTDLTASGMTFWDTLETLGDGDFYLDALDSADPAIYLPTASTPRAYRISLSVVVSRNGRPVRRTYRNLPLSGGVPVPLIVPATNQPANNGLGLPLARVSLAPLIASAIAAGDTYRSIYPDSIRVRRGYRQVGSPAAFSTADPFEYTVLSPGRGLLLFNPLGYSQTVDGSSGREPLVATLDYAVSDWRILHEDMRLSAADNGQAKLAIGTLKGPVSEADGRDATGMPIFEPADTSVVAKSQNPSASYMQITDLDTGGIVCEKDPDSGNVYVTVNKSLGLIDFGDSDSATAGRQIRILLADGQLRDFDLQGRALRVYYMTRDEFAVQVLKPAASYSQTVGKPGAGEFYVGGSASGVGGVLTRLYFPRADANQKVTIGVINYLDSSNRPRQIVGQEFTIRFRQNEENPSIDLTDVDPNAARFDPNTISARDVRGASLTVRTLWNPDSFSLGPDPVLNLRRFDQWNRATRKSVLQTYVSHGEAVN